MAITFDPMKRIRTMQDRDLDFSDAQAVFDLATVDFEDIRQDYGETRIVTIGFLRNRMVVIVWTPRGADRHVLSMRKANEREQQKFGSRLGANPLRE